MGAWFDSIHIRTENSGAVRQALAQVAQQGGGKFLLGPPLDGWISVFPSDSGYTEPVSAAIARLLPDAVFHLLVHDDDNFIYYFYRNGQLIDRYDSWPDGDEEISDEEKKLWQGHPELFQDLLRKPEFFDFVKTLLAKEKFTFESDRLAQFARRFGLANARSSYDYLQAGDQDEDEIDGWDQFVHIEKEREPSDDCIDNSRSRRTAGDLDGALAECRRALELNPGLAEAWSNLGLTKKIKGDFAGALADFGRAIELKPRLAIPYSYRGDVKRNQGDLSGAMADQNQALALDPNLVLAYSNRGLVKHDQKDFDGAFADFNRAIELSPRAARIYTYRALTKRAQGDIAGAQADDAKAAQLTPKSP